MKKVLMMAAAAAGLMASMGAIATHSGQTVVEARPISQPERQTPAPAPSERAVIREAEAAKAARRMYRPSLLDKHKNRAGGERAHRRWRKQRASGRPKGSL